MGRIDIGDALDTARRFAAATKLQADTESEESVARGMDRRRDFMLASERPFLERVIDDNDLMPIRFLAQGQLAARAVGRVYLPPADGLGTGYASGFLVAPGLLLTNHHVLRSVSVAASATLTMDAEDGIDGLPRAPRVFRLEPQRLFVNHDGLDFAFCGVASHSVDGVPLGDYGWLRLFGTSGKVARGEYASIVQHPGGRQKQLAARNNKIIVYVYDDDLDAGTRAENDYLYYGTDTEGGSSGSPVFSDQWYVIALHRRGVPKTATRGGKAVVMRRNGKPAYADDPEEVIDYEANEGVRISRVLATLDTLADTENPQRAAALEVRDAVVRAAGDPADGPFAQPVAVVPLATGGVARVRPRVPVRRSTVASAELEVIRRNLSSFENAPGYDPNFLGIPLPLPTWSVALGAELARRTDEPGEVLLPFRHFTTVMHARRRLPLFAAINIDGAKKPAGGLGGRPKWSYDPRIAEEHQPDDTIFSTRLQRGHLAARDYVTWGDADELAEADRHSFTLTNVCPQIARFNGTKEWYEMERQVALGAKGEGSRVTEFVGPFFQADDPTFDSLRAEDNDRSTKGTRIRVPLQFWKIIVWREGDSLVYSSFLLDQGDELRADQAASGGLELDLEVPEGVREVEVGEIGERTGLAFGIVAGPI